jgi:formylglycine-generating enzyme required for sulfatase activity
MERSSLPALERAAAGAALARLGDPRFDPERFYLPKEPLLGFVCVPAGSFLMGSDKKIDQQAYNDEQPQHEVALADFYLGRYLVTNAQFAEFVHFGGYAEERYWLEAQAAGYWRESAFKGRFDDEVRRAPVDYGQPFNLPNHPVVGVSWYEALAYCRWLGEQLTALCAEQSAQSGLSPEEQAFWRGLADGSLVIGLPSEAEWEKAARGGDGRIYPWIGNFDPDKANTNDTGLGATSPVGCFPAGAGPYGLLDQSGNVLEWTRSLWEDYPYPSLLPEQQKRESLAAEGPRVWRGGSFSYVHWYARCAYRDRLYPSFRFGNLGFRVGASLLPLGSGRSGTLGL